MNDSNSFSTTAPKETRRVTPIGGSMEEYDLGEYDLERDVPNLEQTGQALGGAFKSLAEAVTSLATENIAGIETKRGMSATGTVDLNNPEAQQQAGEAKKTAVQAQNVATVVQSENQHVINKTQEQIDEALRLEVAGLPDEEKLAKLHLSTSMDPKHINDPYHLGELRRAKMEEIEEADRAAKAQGVQEILPGVSLSTRVDAMEGQSTTANAIATAG